MPELLPFPIVKVMFGGKVYSVSEWTPGTSVPTSRAVALDTETRKLVKGRRVEPAIVQAAFADSDQVLFAKPENFAAFMQTLDVAMPKAEFLFFNAPFDCGVLSWPSDPLWKWLQENRMVDLEIRGILHTLQEGTYMDKMNLEMLTELLLKITLCKDEEVRLSFAPGITLSERQVIYAAQDSLATLGCWERLPCALSTEDICLRGYFALKAISDLGLRRDEEERKKLDEKMLEEQMQHRAILQLFGIAPPMEEVPADSVARGFKGTVDAIESDLTHKVQGISGRRQKLLGAVEQLHGFKLLRSKKTGNIVTEKKSLDLQLIAHSIPVPIWMQAFRNYEHARKIRSTYLKESLIGEDGRVHPHFRPLVKTGRVSCSEPNIMNLPRKGGVRGIYIPTDGYMFMASDYSQLELCSLAESCYQRFGQSVMGDLINAGQDVHLWFGEIYGKHQNKVFDPTNKEDPVTAQLRQQSKAANFGIPGGLGPATFVAFSANYGVNLTLDEARELIDIWLEHFPEMRRHLQGQPDDVWTSRNIRIFLQKQKLDAPTVHTLPELGDFLRTQGWSDEQTRVATSQLAAYQVRTVSGRLKRNCTYCSAANLQFQGPAADGAKIALWEGTVRGWRIVDFIHDEILQEVSLAWDADRIDRFAHEVEQVMCDSMVRILPHMKISVESALMLRWFKEAKPKKDAQGRLTIWMPKPQEAATALNPLAAV